MKVEMIVTLLVAVFASTGFWSFLNGYIQRRQNRHDTTEDALMGLLHDRIYEVSEKAMIRGNVYISELDNLEHLAEPYFAKGGNGTGKLLYEEVKRLPKATGSPLEMKYESYFRNKEKNNEGMD